MRFDDDDLLVEVTVLGAWQRVAVLHVGSRREVVVRGPINASTEGLIATARRRLAALLQPPDRRPGGLWV
ncbi:MAG: DUF6898 family protein [Pseudomonadota bacterium]